MVIVEELENAFEKSQQINVYKQGVKTEYSAGGDEYNKILASWSEMIKGAHDMPAFGVSLNDLTVKEMQKGLWVEFDFKQVLQHNEMPFERLLVEVGKENQGFNLIRYSSVYGYEGRCFYLDLVGKNMSAFYDLLQNI